MTTKFTFEQGEHLPTIVHADRSETKAADIVTNVEVKGIFN